MQSRVALLFSRASRGAELVSALHRGGYAAVHPAEARARSAAVAVLDPEALGRDVSVVCPEVERAFPGVPQIVVGDLTVPKVVAALRAGASDYLARGAPEDDVRRALERAALEHALRVHAEAARGDSPPADRLIGESAAVTRLRAHVELAAASDASLVVLGEPGTGKDLVARRVHERGPRSSGPLVVVPCRAIPPALVEAALFGHGAGAIPSTQAAHPGLLASARGGTLVLSGVDALPVDVQARLFWSLKERAVRPLGSSEEVPIDLRLVVTTTHELDGLVRSGHLRADLYYHLAVVELRIPPLRERNLDVLHLAEHFLRPLAARAGKPIRGFTRAAAVELATRSWPGNVLELRNAVEHAVAVARNTWIGDRDLPRAGATSQPQVTAAAGEPTWETIEASHIESVLRASGGNRSRAAEQLGIDRKTLQRKLERYGIDVPTRSRSGTRPRVQAGDGPAQDKPNRFSFR